MVVTIVIIVFYWFMIDIMLSLATSMGNNAVATTLLMHKSCRSVHFLTCRVPIALPLASKALSTTHEY